LYMLDNVIFHTMKQYHKKNYGKSLAKQTFKFRFNNNQLLGTPDAETDHLLDRVFIDNGVFDILRDVENPRCIILGRTGSGKSALIKKLVISEDKINRIAPESMALQYLSNSTILDYFRSIGIKLNFFYKVLWKHVFIVEILKLYLGETDQKRNNLFQNLWSKISTGGKGDQSRKAALEYFNTWSDEFWQKTEYRVKTLEHDLETRFLAETGISNDFLKSNVSGGATKSEKNITEIKHKAEQIISDVQAMDLINLIDILETEVFNTNQKKYFIVIDDLDKEWVSPQIVYDLLGAMIEVVKEFQEKFKGVKIILALRENLHQIIFSGKVHRGGQREKFSPLFLNLTWEHYGLKELINSRLQLLTGEQLNINSVFDKTGKNNISGIDYILERTYLRPRDVISFFNKIIEFSNNKTHFTASIIKQAEPTYSIERIQALEDEWAENYGDISKVYKFLFGKYNGFNVHNIKEDWFADIALDENIVSSLKGELLKAVELWRASEFKPGDFRVFLKELLFILFRVGIIGIKRKPELKVEFFFDCEVAISSSDFENEVKIYVHKSLFSALKINSKEQEMSYLD